MVSFEPAVTVDVNQEFKFTPLTNQTSVKPEQATCDLFIYVVPTLDDKSFRSFPTKGRETFFNSHLICLASGFSSSNHTCNRNMFYGKEIKTLFVFTRVRFSYVVAAVVSELQSKVLLLQQFQMATHFVEEVST